MCLRRILQKLLGVKTTSLNWRWTVSLPTINAHDDDDDDDDVSREAAVRRGGGSLVEGIKGRRVEANC